MKVLFVPMVGGRGIGPICRCLAVAEAFKSAEILFLISNKFSKYVKGRFDYILDIDSKPLGAQGNIFYWNDAAYVMGLCNDEFVFNAFSHQLNVVNSFKPDVIFTEYNLTIILVAHVLRIPVVSTINWADTKEFGTENNNLPIYSNAIDSYNSVLERYNLQTYSCIEDFALSVDKIVAPTTALQQPELIKYGVHYVGELLDKTIEENQQMEELISQDNIYVYLTSSDLKSETWLTVVSEFSKHTSRMVYVVSGDLDISSRCDVSSNLVFNKWFPSLSVLKKSSLVIHSGSANIIAGSLICGVPSLMIPLEDGERKYNSMGIQRLGCGLVIDSEIFTNIDKLLVKANETINDSSYKENCIKVGSEIARLGGASGVVDIMSSLV